MCQMHLIGKHCKLNVLNDKLNECQMSKWSALHLWTTLIVTFTSMPYSLTHVHQHHFQRVSVHSPLI